MPHDPLARSDGFYWRVNEKWRTVGGMLDDGVTVAVTCGRCGKERVADLERIAAQRSREFSLINIRSRCREPGCTGWVSFWVRQGLRYIPLASREMKRFWMFGGPRP